MSYLEDYQNRKSDILEVMNETLDFYKKIKDESKIASLEQLIENVKKGVFSIVVVGQFSSGKSTFLNALMGEKYLPSFTSETTATINFLRSVNESPTKKPLIEICFKNGEKIQEDNVCIDNVEKYVSTKGDDIAHKVDYVNLYIDSPYLANGVTLVDSPGLNGLLEGHKEITEKQIDSSHASIFMFNARQPGSKSDFEILNRLKQRCNSIIIVLNCIDDIKKEEGETVEQVIDRLKENYHDFFPNDLLPEIYPIAAYPALVARNSKPMDYNGKYYSDNEKNDLLANSRIEAFENRLMRYLTLGEKTKQDFLAPLSRIQSFLKQTEEEITESITSLKGCEDAQTIEDEILQLEDEIKNLNASLKEQESSMTEEINNIITCAQDSIKSSTRDIKNRLLDRINATEELDDFEYNAQSYLNRMNQKFVDSYESAISQMDNDFKNMVHQNFEKLSDDIQLRMNENMLSKHNIKGTSISIDDKVLDLDIDLDSFFEKRSMIYKEIDELDNNIEEAEINVCKAKSNEYKMERLQKRLEDERLSYQAEIQSLGARPLAETRIGYRKYRSGGIEGILKYLLNGNPEKQVEYTYYDDSVQKEYDKSKSEIQKRFVERDRELHEKLEKMNDTNSSMYELTLKRLTRNRERLDSELKRCEDEHNEKIARERRKKERYIKSYLTDCIDDIDRNNKNNVLKEIESLRSFMLDIAKSVIKCNISESINKKNKSLEKRKNELESSVADREKLLQEYENNHMEAIKINNNVNNMIEDIDSIESDTIKTEE